MNFNNFLAECRVQWSGFDDPRDLAKHTHPLDRHLNSLPQEIQGMATENKLMLLNLAVRNLSNGEVYVEIGCWNGLTLAGAASANFRASIYACDDFCQFNGKSSVLQDTIERFTTKGQVRFYDMDFRSFLRRAPWQPARVGAYFYDGGHTFQQQYQALEEILPWLSDQAIVIIDDTNEGEVRAANSLFISRASGFQLVSDIRTPGNEFPTWWNGVQIYLYERTIGQQTVGGHLRFKFWRLFWDDAVPLMRKALQAAHRSTARIPGLKSLYHSFRFPANHE